MIVFINGAFGIGKTTLAKGLVKAMPEAVLFDPELVGFMLREIVGKRDPREDFQEYPMWADLVVETARSLRSAYPHPLILPQCVWMPSVRERLEHGLAEVDPDLHLFCLLTEAPVVHRRLLRRGAVPGGWEWSRTERCTQEHAKLEGWHRLDATIRPSELVKQVLAKLPVH
jgi:predicted kinase